MKITAIILDFDDVAINFVHMTIKGTVTHYNILRQLDSKGKLHHGQSLCGWMHGHVKPNIFKGQESLIGVSPNA